MLEALVQEQVELIDAGEPMKAFERFYADNVVMKNNGAVFAANKQLANMLQGAFFNSITNFKARTTKVIVQGTSATLETHYEFNDAEGKLTELHGVHVQQWEDQKIIEEEFFTGDVLTQKIAEGILEG